MRTIENLLAGFRPISLQEMSSVKLMNRVDTKYVTTRQMLCALLEKARAEYFVQEIEGKRIGAYYTLYFDTEEMSMFYRHQYDKRPRQKLRIRSYLDSHLAFLEVKTKDNHGITKKKRVVLPEFTPGTFVKTATDMENADFLSKYLQCNPQHLHSLIENKFERITLVNNGKTERLTIDFNIRFHNFATAKEERLPELVVIELKRDSRKPSPILPLLRELRIKPKGFSKYCIGCSLTDDKLRINRFKPRLHYIEKLQTGASLL
ncbi:MAG: polyphosphate polymerase domain-containing protein [Sodaliphilus sp.]